MGDELNRGAAMKAGNARFNARRAKQRARQKAMAEAGQRIIEADRELQARLKAQCMERNPSWFGDAA